MKYPPNKQFVPTSRLGAEQHRLARATVHEAKRALMDALYTSNWPELEAGGWSITDRATGARAVEPQGRGGRR